MTARPHHPGLGRWLATLVVMTGAVAVTSFGPLGRLTWVSYGTLFWMVVVVASLCVIASVAVIAVAHRDEVAEVGLVGGALLNLSMFGLAHGLLVPGFVTGPNSGVMLTALLMIPAALVGAAPTLLPGRGPSRWLVVRWRWWTAACAAGSIATIAVILSAPSAIALPPYGAVAAIALASFACMAGWSYRQLRLYWVSELPASMMSALSIIFVGVPAIQWLAGEPFGVGFWLVHVVDAIGVFGACLAVAAGHRTDRTVTSMMAPLAARDPLVTLELGLAPVVRGFVAALDAKDPQTRDHVVRVGEIAMRLGEHLRLPPRRLRYLGLAAMLHDVGKLTVDDAILRKPGRLDEHEFERIKRHTIDGDVLLRTAPELAPAAPFVRSHHERVDGAGYPDGLAGDEIPMEARIIAVADAYDAIAQTRHYRDGRGHDTALAILAEHAGSQWDAVVVSAVTAVVQGPHSLDGVFASVGREAHRGDAAPCGSCVDALPQAALEHLAELTDPVRAHALN